MVQNKIYHINAMDVNRIVQEASKSINLHLGFVK